MKGNIFVILLLSFTLLFGATLWYFQNYAYYERNDVNDMTITLMGTGSKINVELDEIKSINSSTSPLKFRSCLRINNQALETIENYLPYSEGIPLRAPNWFKCFNVKNITNDLQSGKAMAYLSEANIEYGIDRVLAIYPNGEAYAWHQINICGSAAFSGEVLPKNCPPTKSE